MKTQKSCNCVDCYPIEPEFYEKCSKITEAYEKLWGRWSDDSQLLHIITEVAEVKDVLRNKNFKYGNPNDVTGFYEYQDKLLDELADVFLTTFATCNKLGIGISTLNSSLVKKLEIVEKRINESLTTCKQGVSDI